MLESERVAPGVLVTLVPAGRLYVTAEDRLLVFPTLTPVPAQVVSGSSPVTGANDPVSTLLPVAPRDAPVIVEEEVDFERFFVLSRPPCLEDFRAMLTGYDRPETFGPEVARRLSAQFAERREDCVAAGWDPKFSLDPVCETGWVQNGLIPITLVDRDLRGHPVARPTGDDYFGSMLVHFDRFPFVDEVGCWFHDGNNLRWYWQRWDLSSSSESRAVRGMDLPRFPGCEEYLRYLMEVEVANNGSWDSVGVARLVARVMESAWEDCGVMNSEGYTYWGLHPMMDAQPGCGVVQETGSVLEGLWVVNWVGGHFDADGNVCWVLRGGDGWYLGGIRVPLLSGVDLPEMVLEQPGEANGTDSEDAEVTVGLGDDAGPEVLIGPGGTFGPVGGGSERGDEPVEEPSGGEAVGEDGSDDGGEAVGEDGSDDGGEAVGEDGSDDGGEAVGEDGSDDGGEAVGEDGSGDGGEAVGEDGSGDGGEAVGEDGSGDGGEAGGEDGSGDGGEAGGEDGSGDGGEADGEDGSGEDPTDVSPIAAGGAGVIGG